MTCGGDGGYTRLGLGGPFMSMPMTSGTPYPDTAWDPSHRPTVLHLDDGSAHLVSPEPFRARASACVQAMHAAPRRVPALSATKPLTA
jgi:hypothetical protein